jgi:hypothetical protein
LVAVVLSFKVFVTPAAHRDDDPNRVIAWINEELPLTGFDTIDGILLSDFPTCAAMNTADMGNALVRVLAVTFGDALNLIRLGHGEIPRSGAELQFWRDYYAHRLRSHAPA